MAKRARMTEGERIRNSYFEDLSRIIDGMIETVETTTTGNLPHRKGSLEGGLQALRSILSNNNVSLSRRIDRAIARERNRAAWDGFSARNNLHNPSCSMKLARKRVEELERKYGPRPKGYK